MNCQIKTLSGTTEDFRVSEDYRNAKAQLERMMYSSVVCKEKEMYVSTQRGVKPLLAWIEEKRDFTGFCAADQVVGRAAALLYVKLGVGALYGRVISEKAEEVLKRYGIQYEYGRLVPYIINRRGDGMCPMEQTVTGTSDPEEAVRLLKLKVAQMSSSGSENK